MAESDQLEHKSLRLVIGQRADWDEVARECVCFANGRGGTLIIGIEDGENEPPPEQVIPPPLPERVLRRISELTLNVAPLFPTVETARNGGQTLSVVVPPSQSVACTTSGRYFARLADECRPVPPEELVRLASEKGAMVWELAQSAVLADAADSAHRARLLNGLRASNRVKESVKQKPDAELLVHYDLVLEQHLTNLGVLWIGRREHRARLLHAPIIQYIRYDGKRQKIAKEQFGDDYTMTPWEQLEAVGRLAAWRESVEIPGGVFRESVPIYNLEVVRELVANALVHRVYTTRGDIFINHFADRLEVHSPGSLPVGVTPQNILHARKRRNEALARLFHDLKLMEGEGTGYDRMYDLLLSSGRPAPEVREGPDRVEVIIRGHNLDKRALQVIATASQVTPLGERERIALGLLARNGPMTRAKLASALSLASAHDVPHWTETLIEQGLVVVKGKAAGQRLKVNPKLLRESGVSVKTTLIDIENHRLRELVRTDVEQFPGSQISDIIGRIGREIPRRRTQRILKQLRDEGVIEMRGRTGTSRYYPST